MESRFIFLVSIVVSIATYLMIVLGVFFYISYDTQNEPQKIKSEIVIDLDQRIEAEEKSSNSNNEQNITPEQVTKEQISELKEINKDAVKNLFSKISGNTLKNNDKQTTNENIPQSMQPNERFESKLIKEKSSGEFAISKLVDFKSPSISDTSNKSSQAQGNFDSYYAKINKMILTRWYHHPFSTDIKYFVSANVTINSVGNFTFSMLNVSGNVKVDEAIRQFLKNQTAEIYPIPPDKLTKTIKINFMPNKE